MIQPLGIAANIGHSECCRASSSTGLPIESRFSRAISDGPTIRAQASIVRLDPRRCRTFPGTGTSEAFGDRQLQIELGRSGVQRTRPHRQIGKREVGGREDCFDRAASP
ncbi:hypothetical protein [Nocardia pseudobrasiliensis]|uniref:hypothetical protein n=1 Tax=Nocardia pseudobrasiliensis TaxID=45979 RepID=UPI0014724F47|nr:hypothetical protein [Nocardia pseudobrasiliensis]